MLIPLWADEGMALFSVIKDHPALTGRENKGREFSCVCLFLLVNAFKLTAQIHPYANVA